MRPRLLGLKMTSCMLCGARLLSSWKSGRWAGQGRHRARREEQGIEDAHRRIQNGNAKGKVGGGRIRAWWVRGGT
jgi:hypothetical protein